MSKYTTELRAIRESVFPFSEAMPLDGDELERLVEKIQKKTATWQRQKIATWLENHLLARPDWLWAKMTFDESVTLTRMLKKR